MLQSSRTKSRSSSDASSCAVVRILRSFRFASLSVRMTIMTKRLATFLAVAAFAVAAHAQVPTPDEYLGYKLGDRFTPYSRILDYFNELAKRSPLITVQQFGETYEHRPLVLAVITSAKNRAQL